MEMIENDSKIKKYFSLYIMFSLTECDLSIRPGWFNSITEFFTNCFWLSLLLNLTHVESIMLGCLRDTPGESTSIKHKNLIQPHYHNIIIFYYTVFFLFFLFFLDVQTLILNEIFPN